jgi:putative ABC transport system ATP-binding protein
VIVTIGGMTTTTIPSPNVTTSDAVRVEHASKRYGSGDTAVLALDDVSVGFAEEEFTAVMGPSGSGKSTLMHCMAGLDTLTSGRAYLGDVDLSALSDRDRTLVRRDQIGFIFQSFNLVPTLSTLENITLPSALAGRRPDRRWLDAVIDTVALRDRLGHKPSELSGGQQQRAAVARALVGRPAIVFADEPTGNLDSRSSADVLGFLRRARRELGQTVVMVTHDPVAAGYADTAVFLADGRVVGRLERPSAETVLDHLKRIGG